MIIENLTIGKFVSRPNRFTIQFKDKQNILETAHLHDPGRLKELLIKDAKILIKFVPTYEKRGRKTKYDVIAIEYHDEWVLLNSSYHNKLVLELIEDKMIEEIKDFHVEKAEYTCGNSRLDFLLKDDNDNEMFLEVKGCTLVIDGHAFFPDAPTTRGRKHVEELIKLGKDNKITAIIILILQNNANIFSPNHLTDPDFSYSLKMAYDTGVTILPTHILSKFEDNSLKLYYDKQLPLTFYEK